VPQPKHPQLRVQTSKKQAPTLIEEMALLEQGYCFVAGLDEAGRGCLAGPVVAAAVILPLQDDPASIVERFAGVNDSKQLTMAARERLYDVIMQHAVAASVGIGPVEIIDERNILQATKYAMRLALQQLRRSSSMPFISPIFPYHNAPSLKATPAASQLLPPQSSPK
jgi:ribonuclease HII